MAAKAGPLTGSARGRKAIAVRLAREDWTEMTRPALESPDHVKNLERWRKKARECDPSMSEKQVERLAEMLRKEHYAEMGRRSGASKRAARRTAPS